MNDMPIERDGAERAAARIASLLPALREAGIETVKIEYRGSHGEAHFFISPEELPKGISRILAEVFPSIPPTSWDADKGGFGTIVIDAGRGRLTIDHNSRYSSEENECWTTCLASSTAAFPASAAPIGDLLSSFRETGIAHVHMHYDSSEGDITIKRIDPPTIPDTLRQALERHACNLLLEGWEISDGSHSVVAIDIDEGRLTVDHRWRTTRTRNSRHSYQLF